MNALTPAFFDPNGIITRRAPVTTSTWDAETGTVEAVIAAGAGVERWDERGRFIEYLAPSPEAVDQVPLLDGHRRGSVTDQLGVADQIRSVGGETRARLTLSRHHPTAQIVRAELSDGRRYAVSVGYRSLEWTEKTDPTTKIRSKTAVRWQLVEVSLVPIPADQNAGTRGFDMTVTPAQADQPGTTPASPPAATPTTVQERAAVTPPQTVNDRAGVNAEIRSMAAMTGLDQTWIDQQIDAGATADQARAAAFEAMRQRSSTTNQVRNGTIQVGTDYNDPEIRVRSVGEALYTRWTPGHQPSEQARHHMGLTTLDIARESLRLRGMAMTGMSPGSILERALHTTSDFPLILGEAVGRTLRESYRAAPSGLKALGRQTTARDFRAKHRISLSEAPRLLKVNESGEFKSGTLAESAESYRLATYGRIIGITRQALINDDLGAFADLARRMGQAAAATEAQLLVDLLLLNNGNGPTMSDGKPLFHADHKNKGTAAALAVDALGAARTSMRKQVGLSGELIDVSPRFLLVPPDLETKAEQIMTALNPTTPEDTNPFAGKLAISVEPRFPDAKRWYVAADPATVDGLEYSYLEGEEGVQIETKAGFEVDGVQIKARLDFGAGFVDWRGWYQNAGQ
jgi:HK97 family phage prohead protease